MSTPIAQDKITVYVAKSEGREFRALLKDEGKTLSGAIGRMIREYIAAAREKAAA